MSDLLGGEDGAKHRVRAPRHVGTPMAM